MALQPLLPLVERLSAKPTPCQSIRLTQQSLLKTDGPQRDSASKMCLLSLLSLLLKLEAPSPQKQNRPWLYSLVSRRQDPIQEYGFACLSTVPAIQKYMKRHFSFRRKWNCSNQYH